MNEMTRVALVGSTGLIGRRVIEISSAGQDVRIVAIARRETPLPDGARMERFIATPERWGEVLEAVRPRALICALGTTWKKSGKDEAAFRAVDQDLVVATAEAAKAAGISNLVVVSSVGADVRAKNFYLSVKGEVEQQLTQIGFKRLDILRPGLLKGPRENDLRWAEKFGILASPVVDPFLSGKWAGYRSIDADLVAEAALGLALRRAAGRFVHNNDGLRRASREWRQREARFAVE
ncbi:MAG: NAD(P)H-binding protein [Pseudomonadota bacterium]